MSEEKNIYLESLKDVVNKDNWKDDNTLAHRVFGMTQPELIDELKKLNVNYIAEILEDISTDEDYQIDLEVFSFVYDNYFHTFELMHHGLSGINDPDLLSGKRTLLV